MCFFRLLFFVMFRGLSGLTGYAETITRDGFQQVLGIACTEHLSKVINMDAEFIAVRYFVPPDALD